MIQIIKQTDEEKMAMYMKLSKKKIIEMLINCNKILDKKYQSNENLTNPVVINSSVYWPNKICDCNRKFEHTASLICDGKCKK